MKNNLFRFGAAVLLLTSLPAMADFSGDYAPANWTTTTTGTPAAGGGSVDTTLAPASIVLNGGDGGCANYAMDPCFLDYTIQVPASGTLSFNWGYATADSDPSWDMFVLINGTAATQISNDLGANTQSGSVTVAVNAGDVIGFRMDCWDCTTGAGTVTISEFSVITPATPIPTLSEWSMIIMAGLVAFAAFITLRRADNCAG